MAGQPEDTDDTLGPDSLDLLDRVVVEATGQLHPQRGRMETLERCGARSPVGLHLRDDLGAGPGVAGLGYAAFSATMLTVRLSGDRLLARFPAHRLLPVLALVAAVGSGAGSPLR